MLSGIFLQCSLFFTIIVISLVGIEQLKYGQIGEYISYSQQ